MSTSLLIALSVSSLFLGVLAILIGSIALALALSIKFSSHTIQYQPLTDILPWGKKKTEEETTETHSFPEDPIEKFKEFKDRELKTKQDKQATSLLMSAQHLFQPITPRND